MFNSYTEDFKPMIWCRKRKHILFLRSSLGNTFLIYENEKTAQVTDLGSLLIIRYVDRNHFFTSAASCLTESILSPEYSAISLRGTFPASIIRRANSRFNSAVFSANISSIDLHMFLIPSSDIELFIKLFSVSGIYCGLVSIRDSVFLD